MQKERFEGRGVYSKTSELKKIRIIIRSEGREEE